MTKGCLWLLKHSNNNNNIIKQYQNFNIYINYKNSEHFTIVKIFNWH